MARCIRRIAVLAVLAALLASCKSGGGGQLSRGDLYPNGTPLNGSVVEGAQCFYVLRNVTAGGTYTLRTQIAPGGTVRMDVFQSLTDYESGKPPIAPLETPVYDLPPNDTMREVVFQSTTSGDHVVVLSGTAGSDGFGTLYFYDLRLMSSSSAYLRTLTTSTLDPASFTSGTVPISPGYLNVYSSPIATAGTYTVSLQSMINTTPSATISYPQMFVYGDGSLAIRSLLYSVTSTTTDFIFSTFTTTLTGTNVYSTTSTTMALSSAVASSVPFSSNGPYILLRGIGQVNYILTVGP